VTIAETGNREAPTAAGVQQDRPAAPALEVVGLTVSYWHKPVLRHVSVTVQTGQLIAIVGPNGAGKSTLVKAVLGLVPIDSGAIRVLGQSVEAARHRIAYVPQTDSTDWDFPVTAREVVLMGRYGSLGLFRRPSRRDNALVEECLATVGMRDYADRHIRQLSGGQQQRIFLARALAQQAEVLLLDEPFAGVDARTESTIFDLMRSFSQAGKTLVVILHNLQILDRFDRVLLLNRQVIAFGAPQQVVTPDYLACTYGGRMSFIDEAEQVIQQGLPDVR
jgi:manganese/zinc/iron transport system ATP- binding protein